MLPLLLASFVPPRMPLPTLGCDDMFFLGPIGLILAGVLSFEIFIIFVCGDVFKYQEVGLSGF